MMAALLLLAAVGFSPRAAACTSTGACRALGRTQEREPQPALHTRLYEYIPIYLTGSTRAQEISHAHYMGEILFPGMNRRPTLDGRHSLFLCDYHWELSFGWTHKSFGGRIFLHRRFLQAHLRLTYPPPAALSGRCGATMPLLGRAPLGSAPFRAIHVRLIPPGGPGYDLVGTHHDGVCGQSSHAFQRGGPQLGDSVDETYLGSSPLLVPVLWSEVDSVEGTFLELEGLPGRLWQRFLSDHDAFFASGDTYLGTHGRSRRIDFFYAPSALESHTRQCKTTAVYAGDKFEAHALHTWGYDTITLRLEGALKSRDLQNAVTILPKMLRLHAQSLRDLADSVWISIVTTPTATSIVAVRKAGKMYAEAAQFPEAKLRTRYNDQYTRKQFANADQITLKSVNPDGPRETCLDVLGGRQKMGTGHLESMAQKMPDKNRQIHYGQKG
ncbi:unnamed protein product [Prorocentrum cordatum]|uniref:Uncharacterized protein n=1 Tax=Prorocentrum cordatum TaxID=2364126 RepID=A0ABN9RJ82_9DINO|nr:unnamed protein product [Polarella glacialis]